MTRRSRTQGTGRCDLCGARLEGARHRARHLRRAHPTYARTVLLRLLAPFLLLLAVALLAGLHAPPTAYLAALAISYGVLFFGRLGSRRARRAAGAAPALGLRRTLREGGAPLLLFIPIVALLTFIVARLS